MKIDIPQPTIPRGSFKAAYRDRMRGEYMDDHPGCNRREAHEHAWSRAIVQFPPPGVDPPEPEKLEPPPPADPPESGVTGLGEIPEDWPQLPPNASLSSEIQWVQASRLDVVEELSDCLTWVHLDRADQPAPSKAAIGWLETSIRAYSKYCDILAKAYLVGCDGGGAAAPEAGAGLIPSQSPIRTELQPDPPG